MGNRTPVVFDRGKQGERLVVFNEDAPSRSQALAGSVALFLLVRVGGFGCALAWAFTAVACLVFYAGRGVTDLQIVGLAVFGLTVATLKPVFVMAMKATHDRGEEAAAWTVSLLLAGGCAFLSLLATIDMISNHLGLFASGRRSLGVSRVSSGIVGIYLAIAVEALATLGPWVIVTGAKAMREAYERPAEAAMPVVSLEPALGSFEAGFSRWASDYIVQDVAGRLPSPKAIEHFRQWASFNGPYMIPPQETFGRTLADYCKSLGAIPAMSGGHRQYQGVALKAPMTTPKLPAIAQ